MVTPSNKKVDDDELRRVLTANPKITLRELAQRFDVKPRTVSRAKRRIGMVDEKHAERVRWANETVEERVAEGMKLLADGAPLAEVERTLHLHSETLQKRHPEQHGWTPEQVIEHAVAIRQINRKWHRQQTRAIPQRWSAA